MGFALAVARWLLQEDGNTSKFETAAGLTVVCLLKYADLLLICFIFTN